MGIRLSLLLLVLALPGCAVTLYGQQTSGGGQTTTTTGSAVRGSTQIGNARVSGSFGNPPPANASGGQVTLSRGGSAALVLGLAVVSTGEVIQRWRRAAPERRESTATEGIAHTCSCYGWQPDLTPQAGTQ